MKRLKKVFLVVLFMICLPVVVDASDKINVYIIVQQNCNLCEKLDDYINSNYANDNEVNFYKINIDDDKNNDLLQEIYSETGIELKGTPVIIIGDGYLEGYQSSRLDAAIEYVKKTGYSDEVDKIVKKHNKSSNVIHEKYGNNVESSSDDNNDSITTTLGYVSIVLGIIIFVGIILFIIKNKSNNKTTGSNRIIIIASVIAVPIVVVVLFLCLYTPRDANPIELNGVYYGEISEGDKYNIFEDIYHFDSDGTCFIEHYTNTPSVLALFTVTEFCKYTIDKDKLNIDYYGTSGNYEHKVRTGVRNVSTIENGIEIDGKKFLNYESDSIKELKEKGIDLTAYSCGKKLADQKNITNYCTDFKTIIPGTLYNYNCGGITVKIIVSDDRKYMTYDALYSGNSIVHGYCFNNENQN